MSEPALHVVDDPVSEVARLLAEAARRGESVVLTGGSVGALYEAAAALEPDWSRASVWWGDERCVPPDDERSNFGLAKRTLLEKLDREPGRVHRIRGEDDPNAAAAAYERDLGDRKLDLLLLGMGPDGHVASLFPG